MSRGVGGASPRGERARRSRPAPSTPAHAQSGAGAPLPGGRPRGLSVRRGAGGGAGRSLLCGKPAATTAASSGSAQPCLTERPGACRPAPPEQPRAVAVMMNRFRKWLYKPKVSGSGGLRDDKARRRLALCPSSSPALPPRPPYPLLPLLSPLHAPLPPSRAPEAAHSLLLSRRYRDSAVASTSSSPSVPVPFHPRSPPAAARVWVLEPSPCSPRRAQSAVGVGGAGARTKS